MSQRANKSGAASGTGGGHWIHDEAGPAYYLNADTPALGRTSAVPPADEELQRVQRALADHLGDDGANVTAVLLNPGLRLSGAAPTIVAGRAAVWAVRQGFDPVEDEINRIETGVGVV
jgi:hypothetical protein